MKKLIFVFLVLASNTVFAQSAVFPVDSFSSDYFAKISVEDTSEGVFMKGWIAVYDIKSGKELIKVKSDELAFDHPDGKVEANISDLPYGDQSPIMYEDFNFDGVKDFAIMDGMKSAYHLPSFNIYLATDKGFKYSKEFSRIAHENTGMFYVNTKEKKIQTMPKSGCCWHQYTTDTVINNKPKAIHIMEDDQTGGEDGYENLTMKDWNGKKMVTSTAKWLDLDKVDPYFSFKVEGKDKVVILFDNNNQLNYAFSDTNGTVDFSYPIETDEESPGFTFDTTKNNLSISFTNKSAHYRVYETPNKIGVDAVTKGILYEQVGDFRSKKGSLRDLLKTKLDNVGIR